MADVDCRACGACCRAIWDVVVTSDDIKHGTPSKMVKAERRNCYDQMRVRGGQCVALKGKPGESVTCSIYAHRPQECRDFQPKTEGCIWARKQARAAGITLPEQPWENANA